LSYMELHRHVRAGRHTRNRVLLLCMQWRKRRRR
jgi:hypothetical protein